MQFGLLPTCYCEAVSETYSNLDYHYFISKMNIIVHDTIATESCLKLLNLPFKRVFGERFTFLAFLQNLLNRFQRLVLLPIETSLLFEWLCVSFPSRFHFQRSIFPGKMGLLVDLKAQDIYSNTSSRGLFHFT